MKGIRLENIYILMAPSVASATGVITRQGGFPQRITDVQIRGSFHFACNVGVFLMKDLRQLHWPKHPFCRRSAECSILHCGTDRVVRVDPRHGALLQN